MNPEVLYGGYAAKRTYSLPGFDAAVWTVMSARLVGAASADIAAANITGSGTDWELTIPAESLASLASGNYTLQLLANNGTVTVVAASETVSVVAAGSTDLRSTARKQLDAINAVIEGKATKDESSISYNGRSISRMSWPDLLDARDRLARQVKAEENKAAGRSKIKTVGMRFV